MSVKQFAFLAFLCGGLVAVNFAIQGRAGFSLWDEGFLWYGAQRVLLGEVPIRDFQAYDPGRYYWCAAVMGILGDNGIVALRVANAIFVAIGLLLAVTLMNRAQPRFRAGYALLVAVTFLLWLSWPQNRSFDSTTPIALLVVLAWFLDAPSRRRCFATGVVVGLTAIIGRNHGLYGAVASLGALVYVARRGQGSFLAGIAAWSGGVAVGYSPLLLALAFVPGFAAAFWESVRFLLFELRATNLPLPVPWPWRVPIGSLPWAVALNRLVLGAMFIALPLFAGLSLLWVFMDRVRKTSAQPAFVSASLLALPYTHYAFSRADVFHLAPSIFPLLVGLLVFPGFRSKRTGLFRGAALLAASCAVMLPLQPVLIAMREGGWQPVTIGGDGIRVRPVVAAELALLDSLARRCAPEDGAMLAIPLWPGAYAVLERRSPIWEIYGLVPRNRLFQEQEIHRLEAARPRFVIVTDLPLDNRESLRYRTTHPLIYEYILRNYQLVRDLDQGQGSWGIKIRVFERKELRAGANSRQPGWNTGDGRPGRNVFRHNGAGADQCALADCHTAENRDA